MIMRIWRGATAPRDADAYMAYLQETGLREYRETRGNKGAWAARRTTEDGKTEFLTVSLWSGMEAIEAFAGPNTERAVFYPDDQRYLVEADEIVSHYEVVGRAPRTAVPSLHP